MPVLGSVLKKFMEEALQQEKYINLSYLPDGKHFKLQCPRKRNKDFVQESENIYKDWDELKGRKCDLLNSKERFLNALKGSAYFTVWQDKGSYVGKFNNRNEIGAKKAKKKEKTGRSGSRSESDGDPMDESRNESQRSSPLASPSVIWSPQSTLQTVHKQLDNSDSCRNAWVANGLQTEPPETGNVRPFTSAGVFNEEPSTPNHHGGQHLTVSEGQANTVNITAQNADLGNTDIPMPELMSVGAGTGVRDLTKLVTVQITASPNHVEVVPFASGFNTPLVFPYLGYLFSYPSNSVSIQNATPQNHTVGVSPGLSMNVPSKDTMVCKTSAEREAQHEKMHKNSDHCSENETLYAMKVQCTSVDSGNNVVDRNSQSSAPLTRESPPPNVPISCESAGISPSLVNTQLSPEKSSNCVSVTESPTPPTGPLIHAANEPHSLSDIEEINQGQSLDPKELPHVDALVDNNANISSNEAFNGTAAENGNSLHDHTSDNFQSRELQFEDVMDIDESALADCGVSIWDADEKLRELMNSVCNERGLNSLSSSEAQDLLPINSEMEETFHVTGIGNVPNFESCQTRDFPMDMCNTIHSTEYFTRRNCMKNSNTECFT